MLTGGIAMKDEREVFRIPHTFFGSNKNKKNHKIPHHLIDYLKELSKIEINYKKLLECSWDELENSQTHFHLYKQNVAQPEVTSFIQRLDEIYLNYDVTKRSTESDHNKAEAITVAIIDNFEEIFALQRYFLGNCIKPYRCYINFPQVEIELNTPISTQKFNLGSFQFSSPNKTTEMLFEAFKPILEPGFNINSAKETYKPQNLIHNEIVFAFEFFSDCLQKFSNARPDNFTDYGNLVADQWKKRIDDCSDLINNKLPIIHQQFSQLFSLLNSYEETMNLFSIASRDSHCIYAKSEENDDFDFEKILNYACSSIDIETITIPTLLLSPGSINQKVEEIKKLCHDDLIIVYMLTIIFSDFYLNSKLKQA